VPTVTLDNYRTADCWSNLLPERRLYGRPKQGSSHFNISQWSSLSLRYTPVHKSGLGMRKKTYTKSVCLCFVHLLSICFHEILGGSYNDTADRKQALARASKARTPNKNVHKMRQLIFGLLGCMLALVS